ncbi:MAG TPA: excinuclease ABC subunit UvrB [bacterium]|nr:excinuclease ABC subunit UvrB [bacterium]
MNFVLAKKIKPRGGQPEAIKKLVSGFRRGYKEQTLLGVTGSGKTFTMASVICALQKPTLVIAHNKTLAAQLTSEFKEYFPKNAVEYFVSYYDYYQPEAYLPNSDTYIEKEATINDEIDRLRHAATQAILTRKDVVVVASVSAIYSLGSPKEYEASLLHLVVGEEITREEVMRELVRLQYARTNVDLERGKFRVRGDTIEVLPVSQKSDIYRIVIAQEKVAYIELVHAVSRQKIGESKDAWIFPAKHYITASNSQLQALKNIENELEKRILFFRKQGKLLEADRIERRTRYDLEMIREIGYCNGVENYSRHFDGRKEGEPPFTLLDYFPKDYLLIIDESHVTVPQVGGMYEGDRSRKNMLIEHGFRLPSAIDNRPLRFYEFEKRINKVLYASATPASYEIKKSGQVVEQIIRPTGLIDPEVEVRPTANQIDNLVKEILLRVKSKERALVTTLTKKMAEDLSQFLLDKGVKVKYLHSDVDTLERLSVLRDLRRGKIDVVVGVNLLREGLDLPEVSLVVILDADKEGFLRSETSLIQTIGRAARNKHGKVILYADSITGSMKRAVAETKRRRKLQVAFNEKHNITPQTIKKNIVSILDSVEGARLDAVEKVMRIKDLPALITTKEMLMKQAADALRFEEATILRNELAELKKLQSSRKRV